MDSAMAAFSREVRIINELGLHARSASRIAQIAKDARSDVRIIRGEEKVDAKSTIDILTLACGRGTTITVEVALPSDREVLDRIIALVENGFGE